MGIADLNWQGALQNLPLAIAAVRPDGGGMEAMQLLERRREQDAQRAERQRAAEAEWSAQQRAAQLAEDKKRDLTTRLVAFGRDVYGGKAPPTEQTAMEAMNRYGIDPMVGVKFMGEWAKYRQTQARERQADAAIAKMRSIGHGGGGAGKTYKPILFRAPDGGLSWVQPGQAIPQGSAPYSPAYGGIARPATPMSDRDAEKAFAEMSVSDDSPEVTASRRRSYWSKRKAGSSPEQAYMDIMTAMPSASEGGGIAPAEAGATDAPSSGSGWWSKLFGGGESGIAPASGGEDEEANADAQWAAFQEEVRRTLAEPEPEE